MSLTGRARNVFRLMFRKQNIEEDLEAELRSFLAMLTDRHLDRGLPLEEAQRAARLELEGLEQVKEQVREVRVGATFESWLQDIRYAVRSLGKSPGFTAVAVLTLALGLGVNTAIFSVFYAVLLRPLPYNHPEQLALVWTKLEKTAAPRAPMSGPLLNELHHRLRLFQDVAGIWVGNGTFTGDGTPEQVKVAFVTENFPALLGIRPALGRVFRADEASANRTVMLLSYGVWQRRFGGDPTIAGTRITFAGAAATVVGVLPRDFQLYFPADSNVPSEVSALMPFQNDIYKGPADLHFLRVLGRLKPAVSAAQAQEDLNSVAGQVRQTYTEFAAENLKFTLAPLHADAVRDVRPALIALFTGAGFVLLISCVNVANLLLARAGDRRKEIAVRSAMGASQGRILRQLLIEGLVLCTVASAAGVALGWIGLHGLLGIRPDYLARMPDVGLNWPVLLFIGAISLGAVLLFGLAPSVVTAKTDLNDTLREAGRTSRAPVTRGVRSTLIAGEVMLGFVLTIGAGLMIRTLAKIHDVRPGFEARNVLTFEVDISGYRRAARINFAKEWEAKVASLPGVDAVGAVSHLPLDDYPNWYSPYRPEGMTGDQAAGLIADYRATTPGYFRAMDTKLLSGRFFDEQDRANGRQVVLVDDMLARSAWPGQSAIGKKIEGEHLTSQGFQPVWSEVVGVVEHIRNHSISQERRGEIYIPLEQSPREHLSFAVRTHVEPSALADTIRRALHERDPGLALSKVRPMTMYVERATAPARFVAVLAGAFAALALIFAAVGIYGVISYSVSRRKHEMGVRMALGASSSDVLRLVMGEGLVLTGGGLLLGIVAAFAGARYLRTLVYGISVSDPLTYIVAALVISIAALIGCWWPASRAASANPVDAIRAE